MSVTFEDPKTYLKECANYIYPHPEQDLILRKAHKQGKSKPCICTNFGVPSISQASHPIMHKRVMDGIEIEEEQEGVFMLLDCEGENPLYHAYQWQGSGIITDREKAVNYLVKIENSRIIGYIEWCRLEDYALTSGPTMVPQFFKYDPDNHKVFLSEEEPSGVQVIIIWVAEKHRNRGVARELLKKLEESVPLNSVSWTVPFSEAGMNLVLSETSGSIFVCGLREEREIRVQIKQLHPKRKAA